MNAAQLFIKRSGQVFTPHHLVCQILDTANYCGTPILHHHVMDNSCGDGAFLCEVVDRYCRIFLAQSSNQQQLRHELETFIHGIELDEVAHQNCLLNLATVAAYHGVDDVHWDVKHANALMVNDYDGLMDYVVGNPPYVRVHHLEENYSTVKRRLFAQDGMTDLYLVFFELGFQMLTPAGRLCYIAPSSWLTSVAATQMRHHIREKKHLHCLIDLAHFQPFAGATTYTMIALFCNGAPTSSIAYYHYNAQTLAYDFVDNIGYEDMCIGNHFYLANRKELRLLQKIKMSYADGYCTVKNGFATLADKVFITDVTFTQFTIPVLKASTGKWHRGFFPYDGQGKPLPKERLFAFPEVATYLESNKSQLLKGKTEAQCPAWYLYGRTQALKDVYAEKFAVNTVIKDVRSIKLTHVPQGAGLYSGLYILTHLSQTELKAILCCEEFIGYLRILKKYKSGGYYTFNALDLEQYINYRAAERELYPSMNYEKQRISGGYIKFF